MIYDDLRKFQLEFWTPRRAFRLRTWELKPTENLLTKHFWWWNILVLIILKTFPSTTLHLIYNLKGIMHWQHILDGLTNMEPVGKKMMKSAKTQNWFERSEVSTRSTKCHWPRKCQFYPFLNWLNDEDLIEPRGDFEFGSSKVLDSNNLIFWWLS